MKLFKWLPVLLLVLTAIASISCKKCEGEGPKFTAEEKGLITDLKASDSLVFRSNAGAKRIFYVFKRDFYEPKDGDKIDPPVKGSATCAVDDQAEATIHLSTMKSTTISDEVLVISVIKDIIASDLIFSGSMMRNSSISRSLSPNVDSLVVNGITYRDVIAVEPDASLQWQGNGPETLKFYYAKDKGLIRFDNAGNEIWERVN